MRTCLSKILFALVVAAIIGACGRGAKKAEKASNSSSIEQEYNLGSVAVSEFKLEGMTVASATHVRALQDKFALLGADGKTWEFTSTDHSAKAVAAPVASDATLFTLNADAFWEVKANSVERSINAEQEQIESQAFIFPEQLSISDMRVIGVDERAIIGLKDAALYIVHFEDSRLYVEKMSLPRDLFVDGGASVIAAGLVQSEMTPWVWNNAGLMIKIPKASGWAKVNASIQGLATEDVPVALALQVGLATEGPQLHSDLVLLTENKLFKSSHIDSPVKTGEHPPVASADWETQVKPYFEASCLSCHSNYASANAWIANKCILMSRISVEKKNTSVTMPPAFASTAQREAMDANDDEVRHKMLDWLEAQVGNCK